MDGNSICCACTFLLHFDVSRLHGLIETLNLGCEDSSISSKYIMVLHIRGNSP